MGESDRYIDYKEQQPRRRFSWGQPGNPLMALVISNLVFFMLLLISRAFFLFTNQTAGASALQFDISHWFSVSSHANEVLYKPWTIISFMFSHGGNLPGFSLVMLMLGNMLWLWAFGRIFLEIAGWKQLIPVYIYGGIVGGLFFISASLALPQPGATVYLQGASCSIMAIAVAATLLHPGYRIFQHIGSGIPVWVLTLIYIALSLVIAFGSYSPRGFALVGGGLAGALFVWLLKKDRDITSWMIHFYNWISNLFNPGRANRDRNYYQTGSRKPYIKTPNVTQQKVDEILDKINARGYQSLTEEEKSILRKASDS